MWRRFKGFLETSETKMVAEPRLVLQHQDMLDVPCQSLNYSHVL